MRDGELAIAHEWLAARAGSEKVFEAMAQTFPEADLFALTRAPGVSIDVGGRPITTTFLDRSWLRDQRAATLALMPLAWRRIRVDRTYETVLTSSHAWARAFPPAATARHFCYCHAPMRWAWHPEFDPRMLRLRRTTDLARRRLRAQDRRTVAHVDSFAANSSAVRDRIRRFYQRDARVIFPPVDTEFYTPGAAPSRDFVLAVSRFIPYKRIDFAIEAAATARVRLVIAGSGPQEGELRRLARRAGGDVTFVISPTDEHLRELYRNALALVFPAHEDFGIVAVEAQACGTPVLALDAGGARDTVLAGVTGHRFAHHDARAFASALTSFADNPLDAAACRRHALGFSIERFKTELREWLADP